jgi:hypothetical protein
VHAVVLDCETIPFVDVTAARMLGEVTADLQRTGVRLVIARDIGQVRDVFAVAEGPGGPGEYFRSVGGPLAGGVDGHLVAVNRSLARWQRCPPPRRATWEPRGACPRQNRLHPSRQP